MRMFPEKIKRTLKNILFGLVLAAPVTVQSLGARALGADSAATKEGTVKLPVAMDVVYGYQNTAKSGRFLPLKIEPSSQPGQMFNRALYVLAMKSDSRGYNMDLDYDVYRYGCPVETGPEGNVNKSVSISLGAKADQMHVRLLDENGDEVVSRRPKLNLNLETAKLFIGVLSDSPTELLHFSDVGINYNIPRTRVIEMMASILPVSGPGLDQLDVLPVVNSDSGKLSSQ